MSSTEKKEKDFWDKVDVVLRPLNGLLTALTVALLGYYTSNIVRQQETRDSNERVYTQLMSSREQADSSLVAASGGSAANRSNVKTSAAEGDQGCNSRARISRF